MPVEFDKPRELLGAVGLPRQTSINDFMREKITILSDLARAEIIRLAKERLHTSEREYVGGVQPVQFRGRTASIVLTGVVPNMVEQGWPAHDLRDTVLRSAKTRTSKDGHRYLSIPFRMNMPGASGRNGNVIGAPYEATDRSALGDQTVQSLRAQVSRDARALSPSVMDGRKMKWGERLSAAQGGPLLRPRHATGLYTGMYRKEKQYGKTKQSTYGTFRTISTNPDSIRADGTGMNWSHPGIEARNLFQVANEYLARVAPAVMRG